MGVNKSVGRLVARFMATKSKGSFKCPVDGCDKKGFESKSEVAIHIYHSHGEAIEQAVKDGILNQPEPEETEEGTPTEKQ